MIDFDPNNMGRVYATYVKSRRPSFKVYTKRAPALNSISYHGTDAAYYRMGDDGRWETLWEGEARRGVNACDVCHADLMFGGRTVWVKDDAGNIPERPTRLYVCSTCRPRV